MPKSRLAVIVAAAVLAPATVATATPAQARPALVAAVDDIIARDGGWPGRPTAALERAVATFVLPGRNRIYRSSAWCGPATDNSFRHACTLTLTPVRPTPAFPSPRRFGLCVEVYDDASARTVARLSSAARGWRRPCSN